MRILIELLGNLANIVYVLGYLVKDIMWLRAWIAVGSVLEVVYSFLVAERPLWTNIFWCSLYTVVNTWQVRSLAMERRKIHFNEEESNLYRTVFSNFTDHEFWKVIKLAAWKEYTSGHILIGENQEVTRLTLITRGSASIVVGGKTVSAVKENTFVGEMGFLTDRPASATVQVSETVRCVEWDKQALKNLMAKDSRIYVCMQSIFTTDLIAKILHQNVAVAAAQRKA